MTNLIKLGRLKGKKLTGLLGLALDGSRLEGVVLRRTNGSIRLLQSFSVTLSLDPLTNEPELVGREIRNHLDAAGVRERYCVLGVPLQWALTAHAKLAELPEADLASFLQIEAERGFPCDVATLMLATSHAQAVSGEKHAVMVGIARTHLGVLEQALRAAQLKPVSLSLGITALQPPEADSSNGVLALLVGENQVGVQVSCGGGLVALRTLEGALDSEGGLRHLHADLVAREVRITLGQLPAEFREQVRLIRIFGPRELAQELAREIQPRFEPMGLKVELVSGYAPNEFGVHLPPDAAVSPAFSLAAWPLAGRRTLFEFLPPKISAWQQLAARYSSGALQKAAIAAGVVLFGVVGLFGFQQWQIARLETKWLAMEPRVRELEAMQKNIRTYRPWFDDSLGILTILRQLTDCFPEDGVVSAKTVEIRDPSIVTCSGIARDNQALLKTTERLRAAPSVSELNVDSMRGRPPTIQYSFHYRWNEGIKD